MFNLGPMELAIILIGIIAAIAALVLIVVAVSQAGRNRRD
jgi:hypothetical protein